MDKLRIGTMVVSKSGPEAFGEALAEGLNFLEEEGLEVTDIKFSVSTSVSVSDIDRDADTVHAAIILYLV